MSSDDIGRLHAEHRYTHQCLKLLHTAVSCLNRPPAGHAFVGLLQEAATYFAHELPRHLRDEESTVFSRYAGLDGSRELPALCEEHRGLLVLAAEFGRWVGLFVAEPTDERWAMARQSAAELEALMRRHMAHEDEVLRQLARAEGARAEATRGG